MLQIDNNYFKEKLIENSRSYGYIINVNNYNIVYINDYLLDRIELAHKNEVEYENKICYEFLHQLDKPCEQCNIDKLKINEPFQNYYHNIKYSEWYTTVETIFEKDNNKYLCHNSYNMTKEITQISDLKQVVEYNNVVIECAKTLLNQNSFEASIEILLKIICEFYGGEYACLFERNYETHMSTATYKYHKKDVELIAPQYTKPFRFEINDTWTKFLRDKSYAYFKSTDEIDKNLSTSYYYNRFIESDRENLLVVSLRDGEDVLGAIEIDNITKNTENIDFITTISAFIVNNLNIRNANLDLQKNIVDLENKNTLNNTMLDCIKTLVFDDAIEISMNKLLDIICDYFSADSTNIFHKNNTNNMLVCEYSFAVSKSIEEVKIEDIPYEAMVGVFNYFQKDGIGYIPSITDLKDVFESNFPMQYEILQKKNINTLILSPLYKQNEIVGFLGVENPKENFNELFLVKTVATFVINHISKNELLNKLEKLSYMDSLTNLYNRNFYNSYIDEFKRNSQNNIGIIFADVNGLKKANDNFGHELGDKLIKWSAMFLKQNINGLIFRIGGDEFVCIIENIDNTKFNNLVQEITTKIDSLGEVHISIGNSYSNENPDIESLIAKADENMYAKKQEYYKNISLDERTVRIALEDLRKSIENLQLDE